MRECTTRAAVVGDFAAIAAIAREGDSGADDEYLTFIASHGSLVVSIGAEGSVVAFGGVISIGGSITMLTDLFVTPSCRGRRVGSALLDNLFGDAERRMTFSSQHAAALPAYRRVGMTPSWHLLYLRGVVPGGLLGATSDRSDADHLDDRPDLVDHFVAMGAVVRPNSIVLVGGDGIEVIRLRDPHGAEAFDDLLSSYCVGTLVTFCAPEYSPVASRAMALGFVVDDRDVFCATPGVEFPVDLHCLHPGLA